LVNGGPARHFPRAGLLVTTMKHALSGALVRCLRRFRHWQQRRRDRRVLKKLDERALRDLGIDRPSVEIDSVITFWRPP
jgi:uncharacterized protein YjiS (DUF1127 family)